MTNLLETEINSILESITCEENLTDLLILIIIVVFSCMISMPQKGEWLEGTSAQENFQKGIFCVGIELVQGIFICLKEGREFSFSRMRV